MAIYRDLPVIVNSAQSEAADEAVADRSPAEG
jgi:hypothetical protein